MSASCVYDSVYVCMSMCMYVSMYVCVCVCEYEFEYQNTTYIQLDSYLYEVTNEYCSCDL